MRAVWDFTLTPCYKLQTYSSTSKPAYGLHLFYSDYDPGFCLRDVTVVQIHTCASRGGPDPAFGARPGPGPHLQQPVRRVLSRTSCPAQYVFTSHFNQSVFLIKVHLGMNPEKWKTGRLRQIAWCHSTNTQN